MTLRSKYGAGGGKLGSDYIGLVPVAGVEPARVISPTDFESASSTNSNTPADIFLYTRTSIPRNLEGYAGGMLKTNEKQNPKNA